MIINYPVFASFASRILLFCRGLLDSYDHHIPRIYTLSLSDAIIIIVSHYPQSPSYWGSARTISLRSRRVSIAPFDPRYLDRMVYIRQHQLPNLKRYQYSGVDHSPVSRFILKPFYNKCVIRCFPMALACVVVSFFFFFLPIVLTVFLSLLGRMP